MALRPTLSPRLTQRQAMTVDMQQSVKILAMTGSELSDFLKDEQDDYPLLEVSYPKEHGNTQLFDTLTDTPTLVSSLLSQVQLMRLDDEARRLAVAVIADLETDGMLYSDLGALADRVGASLGQVIAALETVQSLDPPGVAARSASERWELQLRAQGIWSRAYARLIRALRDGVADPATIARWSDLKQAVVIEMMQVLNSLPTDMSATFEPQAINARVAEVKVIRAADGTLQADLISGALPSVRLSASVQSDATADFAKAAIKRADWLNRALAKRARTVVAVMSALIELQPGYFENPASDMVPLSRRDLAAHLNLAESTITRTVRGKAFDFEGRTRPLAELFSSGVPQNSGPTIAAATIRARIQELLRNETVDCIYSDIKIKEMLETEGITVARRTIAKYREGMDIPKASLRRIQKRLSQRD